MGHKFSTIVNQQKLICECYATQHHYSEQDVKRLRFLKKSYSPWFAEVFFFPFFANVCTTRQLELFRMGRAAKYVMIYYSQVPQLLYQHAPTRETWGIHTQMGCIYLSLYDYISFIFLLVFVDLAFYFCVCHVCDVQSFYVFLLFCCFIKLKNQITIECMDIYRTECAWNLNKVKICYNICTSYCCKGK